MKLDFSLLPKDKFVAPTCILKFFFKSIKLMYNYFKNKKDEVRKFKLHLYIEMNKNIYNYIQNLVIYDVHIHF